MSKGAAVNEKSALLQVSCLYVLIHLLAFICAQILYLMPLLRSMESQLHFRRVKIRFLFKKIY